MLKIFDNLEVFFEDCYRRIGVREYSRMRGVSPPTASVILNEYAEKGLLIKEKDRNYLLFHANSKNKVFVDLSRVYWSVKLQELVEYLRKKLVSFSVVLFGSLSKGEVKENSDIDLVIFANKKDVDFSRFEKELKRRIQIFWFKSLKDVKSKDLAGNIVNGYLLEGRLAI